MTTIDTLAAAVPKLRGVKVDVQGGEMDVLLGATETLKKPDVVWQIEIWPKGLEVAGSSVEAVCSLLESVGLTPIKRTWATVKAQAATLAKSHSYLDVVAKHG